MKTRSNKLSPSCPEDALKRAAEQSLFALKNTVKGLPRVLTDQVLGYAMSVVRVLPDVFRDADEKFDQAFAAQLVFLAGVRKLHAIVASSYWTLENSATLLKGLSIDRIRVGKSDYSRRGDFYQQLHSLFNALGKTFDRQDISQFLNLPLSEVLKMLVASGHR